MPNLLAACSTGAGYEVINVEDCTAAGIIVCNQSGANSTAVSEHVFGIMISLSKKINIADRKMRAIDRLDRYEVEGQNISTKIFDLKGREIWSKHENFHSPSHKTIQWNGLNNNGRKVSNGVYIVVIEGKNQIKSSKIIYLKK